MNFVTYKEMENYIEHMNLDGLVNLCNDIYEWKYITGMLKPDCTLNVLAENIQYWDIRNMEKVIIRVATKKFKKVVSMLMQEVPHEFLRTIKE